MQTTIESKRRRLRDYPAEVVRACFDVFPDGLGSHNVIAAFAEKLADAAVAVEQRPASEFAQYTSLRMTKTWLREYRPRHPFAIDFRDEALEDSNWRDPRTWSQLGGHLLESRACREAREGARRGWRAFVAQAHRGVVPPTDAQIGFILKQMREEDSGLWCNRAWIIRGLLRGHLLVTEDCTGLVLYNYSSGRLELEIVWTSPAHRLQGIGKQLTLAAIDKYRDAVHMITAEPATLEGRQFLETMNEIVVAQ